MVIYNKYKLGSFLNLEDLYSLDVSIKMNALRVNHLFKFSKRLMRSFILLHFYIFTLNPFVNLTYKNIAKYHLKLDSTILTLVNDNCYDNYFKFN